MPKANMPPPLPLNGVFAINKPSGPTSMAIITRLKPLFSNSRLFVDESELRKHGAGGGGLHPKYPGPTQKGAATGKKKSRPNWKFISSKYVKMGGGGTLDPLADGVLVIGVGKGTKLLGKFAGCTKTYRTTGLLGYETDSYDSEGAIARVAPWKHVTREMLESKLDMFRGDIMQTPPIYSALKIDGKPLYEYAREGIRLPRPIEARPVTVSRLELTSFVPAAITSESTNLTSQNGVPGNPSMEINEHNGGDGGVRPDGGHAGVETDDELAPQSRRSGHQYSIPERWLSAEAQEERLKVLKLINDDAGSVDVVVPEAEAAIVQSSLSSDATGAGVGGAGEGSQSGTGLAAGTLGAGHKAIPSNELEEEATTAAAAAVTPSTSQSLIPPPVFDLEMSVSSGTYVRSIVHDLGLAVNSAAHVVKLTRTRQASFVLDYDLNKHSSLPQPHVGINIDPNNSTNTRSNTHSNTITDSQTNSGDGSEDLTAAVATSETIAVEPIPTSNTLSSAPLDALPVHPVVPVGGAVGDKPCVDWGILEDAVKKLEAGEEIDINEDSGWADWELEILNKWTDDYGLE